MDIIYLLLAAFVVYFVIRYRKEQAGQIKDEQKPAYIYAKKQFIMTKAENEFYHALQSVFGTQYEIYPQAHLDLFLDHKTKGQNWKAALSSIQRKSVDFLICSRDFYNPLVAIELDDASHQHPDRIERDAKIDAICRAAGMPLERFKWQSNYDLEEIRSRLAPYLR